MGSWSNVCQQTLHSPSPSPLQTRVSMKMLPFLGGCASMCGKLDPHINQCQVSAGRRRRCRPHRPRRTFVSCWQVVVEPLGGWMQISANCFSNTTQAKTLNSQRLCLCRCCKVEKSLFCSQLTTRRSRGWQRCEMFSLLLPRSHRADGASVCS